MHTAEPSKLPVPRLARFKLADFPKRLHQLNGSIISATADPLTMSPISESPHNHVIFLQRDARRRHEEICKYLFTYDL